MLDNYVYNTAGLEYDRENLRYIQDFFKVSTTQSEWLSKIEENLLEASKNGVVPFNHNSTQKVKKFLNIECGGSTKRFFAVLRKGLAEKNRIKIDAVHKKDQMEYFRSYVAPWREYAPVCFIYHFRSDEGEQIYLKTRITQNHKLGVDIHIAEREFRSI